MSPSSMGCFEEAISPSTSYREGFSLDMCLLISSMQAWKLSRSSTPSLKLDDWMPDCFCMLSKLLSHKKLYEAKSENTKLLVLSLSHKASTRCKLYKGAMLSSSFNVNIARRRRRKRRKRRKKNEEEK